MTITIYQADAFTNKLFGGNPAAICPLTEWLPNETMQKIATENNLAETAFFVAQGDGYKLRWFTPEFESDLCGHATLASAHIIFTELGYQKDIIHFETVKAGVLTVQKNGNKYTMDFPLCSPIGIEVPNGLVEAFGGKAPRAVLRSRDYFMVYDSDDDIKEITPDFSALSKFDTVGFIVTAKCISSYFVSLFFAPCAGIPEDTVSGLAHCNLIPFWSDKLGISTMLA